MNCVGQVACAPAVSPDAGTEVEAGLDAATGSVRCAYFYGSAGEVAGCNGKYPIGVDYSITWMEPDGATMVCNAWDWNVPANCPRGTPCIYRNPMLLPDSSILGACQ